MSDQVTNQYIGARQLVEEIFLDAHGKDQEKSVSVAAENRDGSLYHQIPAGNVLGKFEPDGLHYPLAYDSAQSDVNSANDIEVADALNFRVGDWVELPESVSAGTDRFRQITAVDVPNDTITVDGATFSLSEGDAIEVDPTRSFDTVQNSTGRVTTLEVNDASKFAVGDLIDLGSATRSITFTPTVQNDSDYEVNVTIQLADEDAPVVLTAEFTSDADATAQEIVEGLDADVDEEMAAYVTVSEDDATITFTAAEGDAVMEYTASDNLTTDAVEDQDTTATQVAGVDTENNELTIQETHVTNGDLVVSEPDGQYKIPVKTVNTSEDQYTPDNVLMRTRPQGEVREDNIRGLTPAAKEALKPMITFNQRWS